MCVAPTRNSLAPGFPPDWAETLPYGEAGAPLTMSSLEIAERTGKEHRNVTRDIRAMFDALGVTETKFGSSYRDSTGRSLPCFSLPKRECLILVSGYSVPLRAATWGVGVFYPPPRTTCAALEHVQAEPGFGTSDIPGALPAIWDAVSRHEAGAGRAFECGG